MNDFTDPEGRPAQRLIRFKQDSASGNWMPKDVWWQVRGTTQAERSEENQRRIKLIFPPRTGQYWNTNALNTEREYELTYLEVDVPWSINGMSFDSTLLVKTTYPNNARSPTPTMSDMPSMLAWSIGKRTARTRVS